jgi:hypothetical protein
MEVKGEGWSVLFIYLFIYLFPVLGLEARA